LEKLREPGVKMALIVFVGVAMLFALDHFAHVQSIGKSKSRAQHKTARCG
jgi:hypothetical protein